LALENERLHAELRARVEELERSRERIIEAGLAERRKLERNLHDGAQQRLVALPLSMRLARDRVARDPEGARELLGEAMVELESATGELRELARGIHPAVLSDRGLPAALKALAARMPVPVELVDAPVYVEEDYALDLLAGSAEGVGYLLKDRVADVERFVDSIRRVADGGLVLDPEVVSQMLGRRRHFGSLDELTAREREVLALMSEGRSNHAIAMELVVTDRAVEKHVTLAKLNLPATADDHRRVLAMLAYLQVRQPS
jgi:DNA-binding NarL/FixJ family response regulator